MYRPKLNSPVKGDLEVQIIDWSAYDFIEETDDDDDTGDKPQYGENKYKKSKPNDKKYIIRMYGINAEGQSVCVHIINFTPYFFIKIPQYWNEDDVSKMMMVVKQKMNYYMKKALISYDIVYRKDFYGFSNNTEFKFVRLVFMNYNAFNKYKDEFGNIIKIDNKSYRMKLYESNISPMLRFMHCQDIAPAAWIKIKNNMYEIKSETRCQIEVSVDWKDVQFLDKNDIGPIMVASFDIECTSGNGEFPTANKKTDKVIQIGTTLHRSGEKECFLHHIITLKKPSEIKKVEVGAKNVVVEYYDTEKEVILAWAQFLNKVDPDMITGWNIWGFDMKYLYDRAENGNGGVVDKYSILFLDFLSRNKE